MELLKYLESTNFCFGSNGCLCELSGRKGEKYILQNDGINSEIRSSAQNFVSPGITRMLHCEYIFGIVKNTPRNVKD